MKRKLRPLSISLLVLCVVSVSIFLFLSKFKRTRDIENCAANLHYIGSCILVYETNHKHEYPESLRQLMMAGNIPPQVLVCPASDELPSSAATTQAIADDLAAGHHVSYIYVGKGLTESTATETTVVAFEPVSDHGDGVNILFGDGRVEFIETARATMVAQRAATGQLPIQLPRK